MKQMISNKVSWLRLAWQRTRSRFLKFKLFILPIYKAVGRLLLRAALLIFLVLVSVAIISTVGAIGLAMVDDVSWFGDSKFLSFDYWRNENKDTSRSEIVRNLGLVLVAFIGLAVALWRLILAGRQQSLAERGLITDRINKSVEHLGNESIAVRLGGIYTLWRLIDEIPNDDKRIQQKYAKTILEILASFVRHHVTKSVQRIDGKIITRADARVIIQLLGEQTASYRSIIPPNYRIDLNDADLQHILIENVDLSNATAMRSHLSEGSFMYSNFTGVDFTAARLEKIGFFYGCFNQAIFDHAVMTNGWLVEGSAKKASFKKANLSDVNMSGTDYSGADFEGANLSGVVFISANLAGVNFKNANLSNVDFTGIDLSSVNFEDANLSGTDLMYAKQLTQEQIDSAVCDQKNPPKLSGDFTPPTRTPEDLVVFPPSSFDTRPLSATQDEG